MFLPEECLEFYEWTSHDMWQGLGRGLAATSNQYLLLFIWQQVSCSFRMAFEACLPPLPQRGRDLNHWCLHLVAERSQAGGKLDMHDLPWDVPDQVRHVIPSRFPGSDSPDRGAMQPGEWFRQEHSNIDHHTFLPVLNHITCSGFRIRLPQVPQPSDQVLWKVESCRQR